MFIVERFRVKDGVTPEVRYLGDRMKSGDSALFGWFGRLPAPNRRGFPEVSSGTGSVTSDKKFFVLFVFHNIGDRSEGVSVVGKFSY